MAPNEVLGYFAIVWYIYKYVSKNKITFALPKSFGMC